MSGAESRATADRDLAFAATKREGYIEACERADRPLVDELTAYLDGMYGASVWNGVAAIHVVAAVRTFAGSLL